VVRKMSPELILYLLSWATFFSGYPMPEEQPIIIFVPHSYFVMKICGNFESEQQPCHARAMYDDNDPGIIWMDRAFNTKPFSPYAKAIIVHEMVHYLQDLSGYFKIRGNWTEDKMCAAKVVRQREAYYVQDTYSEQVHRIKRLLRRRISACGEF